MNAKGPDNGMILHSRIHTLNGYINPLPGQSFYIKRDDELSSGISGSKYRKYAGLLPFLLKEKFDEVVIIGSAHSNNVSGLLQLLNENQIPARLILLKAHAQELTGNLLWTSLLHPLENVIWIERENWPGVNETAASYASDQLKEGKRIYVLPEGAALPQAAVGAMSLADDILRNEKESGLRFDHILADSGTGTTAIGMLTGFALKEELNRQFHITLIAGDEGFFRAQFEKLQKEAARLLGIPEIPLPENVHFYKPAIAPSFGSVNNAVLQEVKTIARQEGILMDPLYAVKHLYTVKKTIAPAIGKGNILFINSGGSLSIAGFATRLAGL